MSMSSIRQLNSGGLKLKTNFNAKAIARNMASGRSLAASFVKGGYNTFGSNSIFTPARRIGGTPRYMNAAQISSRFNGQNFSYAGESIPSYSGVNYAKNFTMGTSDAFNTGMGVGSLLNLGISAYQQLKDMGIISSKDSSSAGSKMTQAFNKALGNYASIDSSELGSAGIQTAESLGSSFSTNKANIEAMISKNDFDPEVLTGAAENLVGQTKASYALANSNMSILQSRGADIESKKGDIEAQKTQYEGDVKNKNTELAASKGKLTSAKNARADADLEVKEKDSEYRELCSNLSSAEAEVSKDQTQVSNCKQVVSKAEVGVSNAQANLDAANALPDDDPGKATAVAQAEEALTKAKSELETAKNNLSEAENKLKTDQGTVNDLKAKKEAKLDDLTTAKKISQEKADACKDAQKNVDKTQTQYNTALENKDKAEQNLTKINAEIANNNGVIEQLNEYKSKIDTLKNNVSEAENLQKKAKKAAKEKIKQDKKLAVKNKKAETQEASKSQLKTGEDMTADQKKGLTSNQLEEMSTNANKNNFENIKDRGLLEKMKNEIINKYKKKGIEDVNKFSDDDKKKLRNIETRLSQL